MGVKFNEKLGCWEAYYSQRHPATGQSVNTRRRGFKTEASALKAEKELVRVIDSKIRQISLPKWEDLINVYLRKCEEDGQAKKSIYNADKCLKAATLPRWFGRLIDSISTEEIKSLINVEYAGKSETHRKAILKFIRSAFSVALERNWINRNPAPTIKFKCGRKLRTVLTYEHTRKLLDKAQELNWPWYPHVLTAVYTGMRSGELYALTWDKVDLQIAQIRVDRSWNNKDGFKCTKSGDDRLVDVAPELLMFLKNLKLQTGQSGFVLPRLGRWDKGEQARELQLFLQAIGIPPVRFHDLRATWATLMLSRGVEPVKVMSMGGWRDLKTMMRYIREAGIDIKGISSVLQLHDPSQQLGQILKFGSG